MTDTEPLTVIAGGGRYRDAVGEETGCLLKVHTSNYRVEGFAGVPRVAELATLGLPVVADVGSGLLAPERVLPDEPDAATWLDEGATVVTASGVIAGVVVSVTTMFAAVIWSTSKYCEARPVTRTF